ncbi:complement resistance protein TraT [Maridesulfovibrio sp.]|uniref:complement resistance protein TraT n=1 Tax=Maridesulfovibrio sp. TaxID=2795000 RepID=UPI0029F45CEB|nr:complement resistance protein TraT [Maridesulfovibrio sp.]
MKKRIFILTTVVMLMALVLMTGCRSKQRMGMVREENTGLMYGSMTSSNFVVDASQFDSPVIKLTIRNTSGDPAINLKALRRTLERAYTEKGYKVVKTGKYSMHLDINLRYSGQISQDMVNELSLWGGAGGAYMGGSVGQTLDSLVLGSASGAAIGAIIGQYVTQDTYIMVADVVLGIVDKYAKKRKFIVQFDDTQIDWQDQDDGFTSYRSRERLQAAVYAGGDNTAQSKIVQGVTLRFKRILQDII